MYVVVDRRNKTKHESVSVISEVLILKLDETIKTIKHMKQQNCIQCYIVYHNVPKCVKHKFYYSSLRAIEYYTITLCVNAHQTDA